jgi:hypothetical protein
MGSLLKGVFAQSDGCGMSRPHLKTARFYHKCFDAAYLYRRVCALNGEFSSLNEQSNGCKTSRRRPVSRGVVTSS